MVVGKHCIHIDLQCVDAFRPMRAISESSLQETQAPFVMMCSRPGYLQLAPLW